MASPMAASAAATVSTNIANTWPTRSPSAAENATRFKLTASRISSIDIRMMMTFLRLRKMPKMPSTNRIAETTRKGPRPTSMPMLVSRVHFLPGVLFRYLRREYPDLPGARSERHRHQFHGIRDGALGLRSDALVARGLAIAQGQHDGADHCDKQDQARRLEQEDVVCIEQPAQRGGVADLRRRRREAQRRGIGRELPAAEHQGQFDEQYRPHSRADREIALKSPAEFGKVHVQHHHHEKKQYGDGADVDNEQDHRQELGACDQEQRRCIEE